MNGLVLLFIRVVLTLFQLCKIDFSGIACPKLLQESRIHEFVENLAISITQIGI